MKAMLFFFLFSVSVTVSAGIQVDQTRVIYNGNERSASLSIRNDTNEVWMVQTWLDTGNASNMPAGLPVQVVPPILKLGGNKAALLRFIYSGAGLPADKESVYWINVQEIPPVTPHQNALQIAVRTRIKLFYRPAGLTASLNEAARSLSWHQDSNRLVVTNSSPLHVTLGKLTFPHGGKKLISHPDMVHPRGALSIPLPAGSGRITSLSFTYINDFGGHTEIKNIPVR